MKHVLFAALMGSTALIPAVGAAQTTPSQPNLPAAAANQVRPLPVSQIKGKDVYNLQGKDLGEVERVILGQGDQVFAVVKFGEFLGLGGEARIVPLSRMALREDRIVVAGMPEAEFKALPTWRTGLAGYRDAENTYQVRFPLYVAANQVAPGAADAANIVVRQPAPVVTVDPADPRVTVTQAKPQVTVRQPQPEILVRQPAPTVTVDIPQPEVTVRMPQPDVNVAVAQPDVQVTQAKPQVQVLPAPQPQVQVQQVQPQVMVQRQTNAESNVQVQRAEGQPTIRYERAEPRVIVNQAPGQPNVRIEGAQGEPRRAVADQAPALVFVDFDRDRNRQLTNEEFRPLAGRVYATWDGNQNRRLERNEFYGGVYNVWDMDRDGRVNEDEYNRAWGTWGRGLDRIDFARFDRNRDRFIDREEFGAGWGDGGLYERWDADRGGWLAENEFGTGLFGIWDGDRGGSLAENEFNTWGGYNWGVNRVALAPSLGAEPAETASLPRQTRALRIADLEDKEIYNLRGEKLGEVKRVVYSLADKNKRFIILEHGGFLGLGEKEVPLPAGRVFVRGDRLVVQGMSEAEVNAMPDWDMNNREHRDLAKADTVELGLIQ